jgi:hypothetical protein
MDLTPRDWPIVICVIAAFTATWVFFVWLTWLALRYLIHNPWMGAAVFFGIVFLILAAIGDDRRQRTNTRLRQQWKERG